MAERPALLLHCQHSLGLGHLVRSLALASALSRRFRVTVLCGGPLPKPLAAPPRVELVSLPALHAGEDGRLVSPDGLPVERALELRRARILATFDAVRPRVVLVELFPFGRKKLAPELLPLLDAARRKGAFVATSLRDLLVTGRSDQEAHDERARELADGYLDAVLVHADPRFARLEETFRPRVPLRAPVHYTGFVTGGGRLRRPRLRTDEPHVVASAGGGRVGGPLLRAAIDAHRILRARRPLRTTVVAGPLLADGEWQELEEQGSGVSGLQLRRSVPDLAAALADASASVSQCGYNAALDLLRARVPALVVPFAAPGEDEQQRRASRLAELGLVRVLAGEPPHGNRLASALDETLASRPPRVRLDLNGAETTARLLERLTSGGAA
ncbi:MAG TPA: glycosyltransferase [Gaiellaceae bacterium]|nr:glycosyltransferase [Gaiellaceae bacterium]